MKLKFAVVYERTPDNYGVYAPDLPGCVSVGETWEEAQAMMREAIAFHIEAMLEHGEPLPEPHTSLDEASAFHEKSSGNAMWKPSPRSLAPAPPCQPLMA